MAKVRATLCCGGMPHGSVNVEIDCLKKAIVEARRERDDLARKLMLVYGETK